MLRALLVVSLLSASQLSLSQQSGTSRSRVPAKVYVYDQMSGPMTVAIGNNGLTVLQALATAEGMESTAKLRYAEIIRKTENGPTDILLDVQGVVNEKAADVNLQPNDVLYISSGKPLDQQLLAIKSGRPVPEVNADDLKAVWKLYAEQNANHPGDELLAPSMRTILAACTPGADVMAILDRIEALRFLVEVLQKNPETQSLLP